MSAINHRRYNVVAQVLALKAHVLSPSCYRYLQALNCISIIMPLLQNRFRERLYNLLRATNIGFNTKGSKSNSAYG